MRLPIACLSTSSSLSTASTCHAPSSPHPEARSACLGRVRCTLCRLTIRASAYTKGTTSPGASFWPGTRMYHFPTELATVLLMLKMEHRQINTYCTNIDTQVGKGICVGPPGGGYQPSTTLPPISGASNPSVKPLTLSKRLTHFLYSGSPTAIAYVPSLEVTPGLATDCLTKDSNGPHRARFRSLALWHVVRSGSGWSVLCRPPISSSITRSHIQPDTCPQARHAVHNHRGRVCKS